MEITTNKTSQVFAIVISASGLPQNCLKSFGFEKSIKRTIINYRNRDN